MKIPRAATDGTVDELSVAPRRPNNSQHLGKVFSAFDRDEVTHVFNRRNIGCELEPIAVQFRKMTMRTLIIMVKNSNNTQN